MGAVTVKKIRLEDEKYIDVYENQETDYENDISLSKYLCKLHFSVHH